MSEKHSGHEPVYYDPLQRAVHSLFGIPSLFPYQRLVVANILEAAEAAGMQVLWPEGPAREEAAIESEIADALFPPPLPAPVGAAPDPVGAAPVGAAPDPAGVAPAPRLPTDLEEDREQIDSSGRGKQIVILPTGAGKSLCFQLPALLLSRPTLVIFPILSLMADQERRLAERGFTAVSLRGGQDKKERQQIFNAITSGRARFIIANPEVLATEAMLKGLGNLNIGHLVIDEAHCVSEWGESFRPSYLELGKIIQASKAPLVTAFTATASAPVLEKIESYIFGQKNIHRIIGNPDRPNIRYYALGAMDKDIAVLDLLNRFPLPAIIFCSSRNGCKHLAHFLRAQIIQGKRRPDVRFYHAGLEREEKTEVNSWYLNSDSGILIATCAWGMGVDKSNIRTVIHRDCSPSIEAYLQESGRAGRDGQRSHAILLYGPEDARALERCKKTEDRLRLSLLLEYARNTATCRREQLLTLMGADFEFCPACDICAGIAQAELRERGLLLRYIQRNNLRVGLGEASSEIAQLLALPWQSGRVENCIKYLEENGDLRLHKKGLYKGRLSLAKRPPNRRDQHHPQILLHPLHPLQEVFPL